MEKEKFYPTEENLGSDCRFWNMRCNFPKAEVQGRLSCEGIIDDVCLYLLEGNIRPNLTPAQLLDIKISPPSISRNRFIPPSK